VALHAQPPWEQRWERRHVAESVHNAGASAATVASVENSYMHGALLAKGATAAIEHSEHWKTLLIDYIYPTNPLTIHMRIPIHNPPSTAAPIHRRTYPSPHPSTTAPSYHRAHLPPYANIARIATSSASSERVRQWQEWQEMHGQSSTTALIYHPTQPQLVSQSQAHLANMLDNGKSGKEVHLRLALLVGH
jgi:hypothetical protein